MDDEKPIHETATEARGGTGPISMRVVLIASLLLVVVAFSVIVATGAM